MSRPDAQAYFIYTYICRVRELKDRGIWLGEWSELRQIKNADRVVMKVLVEALQRDR